MFIEEDDYLKHYGTPRRSGRYPWGSGEDPYQNSGAFLDQIKELREQGLSETEIAQGMKISTTQLRAFRTIAINERKQADILMAQRLREKGYGPTEIGRRMGVNESTVRGYLAPGVKDKADVLTSTSDMLMRQVGDKGYIDVGTGVENQLGIARPKLDSAIEVARAEGYELHEIKIPQVGTDNLTTLKVLAPPGTEWKDIQQNQDKIRQIQEFSEDGGRSFTEFQPPLSVDSSRIKVRYAEEGGDQADGMIYIRPGVDDISLGGSRYAQVRIGVDDTHYLKGMAIYKDDLPDGVDIEFNTNKSNTGNKLDAMKEMKRDENGNIDMEAPFGSTIKRQLIEYDDDGKPRVTSAANIVNEEGDWGEWSRNLSSQMLSKQAPEVARSQLEVTYSQRKDQFDKINALTNPTVRQAMLDSFADDADAAAVHLKAAALPRQAVQVLLPVPGMSDREIYAPNYRDGERVALVRFPHGGRFEIPELTVNNRNPDGEKIIGQAKDAVGINAKVAARMSGADFDGDFVLVIPNNSGRVKSEPALAGLKDFDPQIYKIPKDSDIPRMDSRTKGMEMGKVTNLIADMQIKGADSSEVARAVRHSMVVIDGEKHELNWRQSADDNGIPALMKKYQGRSSGSAATLITRATADAKILDRKPRSAKNGGPVDKETGRLVYEETGKTRTKKDGTVEPKKIKIAKLANTDDANTLSSGSTIEGIYASHSNRLKALANEARKESVNTKPIPYSPSAKAVYTKEVDSLNAKLNKAMKNRPRERQAQVIANSIIRQKRKANPDMDKDELKKVKARAIHTARARVKAERDPIIITDDEWNAIQAGAVAPSRLKDILRDADMEVVKKHATPKTRASLTPSREARAKAMLRSGRTQREVADALGVSVGLIGDLL